MAKSKSVLLGEKEACARAGVSRVTLWRWRRSGKIRSRKVGATVVFHTADLDKLTKMNRG